MIENMKTLAKTWIFGCHPRAYEIKFGLLAGRTFLVDPRNQSQRLLGFAEREIAPAIRAFAARARTAVDVGANDGWYTVYFAAQWNIEQVLACEPDPLLCAGLRRNLELNVGSYRQKVSIIEKFIGKTKCGNWIDLDSLLQDCAEPILIKVDIDGGEADCLEGMASTLMQKDVLLVVETHSSELEAKCLFLCEEKGYRGDVIPNGWYRSLIPERRPIPHNRWFRATKR